VLPKVMYQTGLELTSTPERNPGNEKHGLGAELAWRGQGGILAILLRPQRLCGKQMRRRKK